MKKFTMLLGAVAVAMGGTSAANATPDKPLNAAQPGPGTGCFTKDGNGLELFDPNCSTFLVFKSDADGNIERVIYHDNAMLQDPQVAPDHAITNSVSFVVFGLSCTGTERITPSGSYSSNQVCTPL